MIDLFKQRKQTRLEEISQYVKDLEDMHQIRADALKDGSDHTEILQLNNTIECMQAVLLHLNERLLPKDKRRNK